MDAPLTDDWPLIEFETWEKFDRWRVAFGRKAKLTPAMKCVNWLIAIMRWNRYGNIFRSCCTPPLEHISRLIVAIFTFHADCTPFSSRTKQNWITPNRTWNELPARRESIYHFHHPFSRQMRLMPNTAGTVFYYAYYEQVFTVCGGLTYLGVFFKPFS